MTRSHKIVSRSGLSRISRRMGRHGERLVLTNGCFDLLHSGHVRLLQQSRRLGDALAVAVNSDTSVRKLKGHGRPVIGEKERLEILAALEAVDYVLLFHEETPERLIRAVRPAVLVKGGDWGSDRVVGRKTVEDDGGVVRILPLRRGVSTTRIIRRIVERFGR